MRKFEAGKRYRLYGKYRQEMYTGVEQAQIDKADGWFTCVSSRTGASCEGKMDGSDALWSFSSMWAEPAADPVAERMQEAIKLLLDGSYPLRISRDILEVVERLEGLVDEL